MSEFAAIAWREMFAAWELVFEQIRRQAGLIMFGGVAVYHRHFMSLVELTEERRGGVRGQELLEQGPVEVGLVSEPFFEPQLQELLDAAADRVYGDGFKLSQRIWRLDQAGLAGIQKIISETIANGDSAWNAAKRLEVLLGMGQDCPRWTSTRLFRLTKSDIAAGDRRGLISGSPCGSKGVAYNALRLVRNEIQIVHGAATDAIFARQPWVQQEKINLSPSHPPIKCKCEDIVVEGEKRDGAYPLGKITLPIHVQCLCFKTAVLMDNDDFVTKMRGG